MATVLERYQSLRLPGLADFASQLANHSCLNVQFNQIESG
jgi:hypothetical protein